VGEEPTFQRKEPDDPEFDCGRSFILNIFDFTPSFQELGYWNSDLQLNQQPCDKALANIRTVLLQLQSEQVIPRPMSKEEQAYFRFPYWWFGQYENTEPMNIPDRKQILMRHLMDMYNEIRFSPELRSPNGPAPFYSKSNYSPKRIERD
jgi:hypothetical protein